MRLAIYNRAFFLILVPLLHPTILCTAQSLPDCSRIITTAESKGNGWTGFHDARVTSIDLSGGLLGVELNGKRCAVYFTNSTEVCSGGKHVTIRDLKIGEKIGGFTKLVQGKTVAVILGFKPPSYPSGIPVPGKEGWVCSPYAPSKPPISTTRIPSGALMKCPYTGKLFRNPAPSNN